MCNGLVSFILFTFATLALIAAPCGIDPRGNLGPSLAYASGPNSGPSGGGDDNESNHDNGGHDGDNGNDGSEHVNPDTGVKFKIKGKDIEVRYPNGMREEIHNGLYEMKDRWGRRIVKRSATPADRVRLIAIIDRRTSS